jgi:Putative auto-transporter adhesin, head GIN domain
VGVLDITATGGSDVYISGTASRLSVEATGGSDLHGYELVTDFCNVSATGGSDIKIGVNKELNVTASGGSDVYYKGTAVVRQLSSSGSSDIIKKG